MTNTGLWWQRQNASPNAPVDGQVPVWNATLGVWEAADVPAASIPPDIQPPAAATGTNQTVSGGDSLVNGVAGDLTLTGGDAPGSGAAGDVIVQGGESASGTDGAVLVKDHLGATMFAVGPTAATLGLFGATPVVRRSAFTQTYSTASRTVANATTSALATTATTQTTPFGFASGAQGDAIATKVNQLITDVDTLRQLINSLIDDSQAVGIAQ